jgi:molybdopterin-binding protein
MGLSARNQLPGIVEDVRPGDIMAHVMVRVGESVIESVITRTSAEELFAHVSYLGMSFNNVPPSVNQTISVGGQPEKKFRESRREFKRQRYSEFPGCSVAQHRGRFAYFLPILRTNSRQRRASQGKDKQLTNRWQKGG